MVDRQIGSENFQGSFEAIRLHLRDLGLVDQASFIAESVRYSNPEFWEVATTTRSRRITRIAGQLVIDHRDFYVDLLDNVAVQTVLVDFAEAEAKKGSNAFATALAGFRNAFSGELATTDDAQFVAAIDDLVRNDIDTWIEDPVIIEALRRQNRETFGYSKERTLQLESQWYSEFESGAHGGY